MAKMTSKEIEQYVRKLKNPDDQQEARDILTNAELTDIGSFVSSAVIDQLEAIELRNLKSVKRR